MAPERWEEDQPNSQNDAEKLQSSVAALKGVAWAALAFGIIAMALSVVSILQMNRAKSELKALRQSAVVRDSIQSSLALAVHSLQDTMKMVLQEKRKQDALIATIKSRLEQATFELISVSEKLDVVDSKLATAQEAMKQEASAAVESSLGEFQQTVSDSLGFQRNLLLSSFEIMEGRIRQSAAGVDVLRTTLKKDLDNHKRSQLLINGVNFVLGVVANARRLK